MKTLVLILVVTGLSFAAAYTFVSHQKNREFERERAALRAQWEAEKAELQAALDAAENKPAQVGAATAQEPALAPGIAKISPGEILEKLTRLKPAASGSKRAQTVRFIVHELESLVEAGPEALPAIRAFLARNVDMDYSRESSRDDEAAAKETKQGTENNEANQRADGARQARDRRGPQTFPPLRQRNNPSTEFTFPPSLRLGLVDVVKRIGGEPAESILAEMLATTGRGVEVAHIARALEEMAPNKYRELALTVVRELLVNPPAIEHPGPLDENAKGYLYGVLNMYKDVSFASFAQNLLVTPDGHIDQNALSYLNSTLHEQAMPAIYQAFKDARLTNLTEKATLINKALNYAGSNPHANAIFNEVVNDQSLPSWMRNLPVLALSGAGGGLVGGSVPNDPQVIQARLQLLEATRPQAADQHTQKLWSDATKRLNQKLNPKPADSSNRSRRPSLRNRNTAPPPVAPAHP